MMGRKNHLISTFEKYKFYFNILMREKGRKREMIMNTFLLLFFILMLLCKVVGFVLLQFIFIL